MKASIVTTTLSLVLLGIPVNLPDPALAQPSSVRGVTYVCGTVNGVPATIAKTPGGAEVVVIEWVKSMGSYNPRTRCEMVSSRFQTHANARTLRFITSGTLNGQPIICVATQRNGRCLPNGLLFTLRPGENPRQFLVQLVNTSRYASSPPILHECTAKQVYNPNAEVYVDIAELLYQCPPASPTPEGQP
uniref:Secreted protein n=1 Tax=Cyanothece sp. (strain PCC 7425 / ATCC 29141) TaxID=395961 RepID=B8HPQ8_CYAP4